MYGIYTTAEASVLFLPLLRAEALSREHARSHATQNLMPILHPARILAVLPFSTLPRKAGIVQCS